MTTLADFNGDISQGQLREFVTKAINDSDVKRKPTQVKLICTLLDQLFSGKVSESHVNNYLKGTEKVRAGTNTTLDTVPSLGSIASPKDGSRNTTDYTRILAALELVIAYEAIVEEWSRDGARSPLHAEAELVNRRFATLPGYNEAHSTKYFIIGVMWDNVEDAERRLQKLNTFLQVGRVVRSLTRFGKGTLTLCSMKWSDLTQINITAMEEAMDSVEQLQVGTIFAPYNAAITAGRKFGTVSFKKEETLEQFFRRISW